MISEAPAFSPRGVNQSATIMKATDSQMKSIGSIGLPQVSSLNRKPFTMTPNNLLECAGYLLLMPDSWRQGTCCCTNRTVVKAFGCRDAVRLREEYWPGLTRVQINTIGTWSSQVAQPMLKMQLCEIDPAVNHNVLTELRALTVTHSLGRTAQQRVCYQEYCAWRG